MHPKTSSGFYQASLRNLGRVSFQRWPSKCLTIHRHCATLTPEIKTQEQRQLLPVVTKGDQEKHQQNLSLLPGLPLTYTSDQPTEMRPKKKKNNPCIHLHSQDALPQKIWTQVKRSFPHRANRSISQSPVRSWLPFEAKMTFRSRSKNWKN